MRLSRLLALTLLGTAGCSLDAADRELDGEDEPTQREAEATKVGAECTTKRKATGYQKGSAFAITIVDVDGKPVELSTASAYLALQRAAAKSGVGVRVVSGFRTNAEQKALYQAYLDGRGNLAAKPGYSNHQSGHALDLNRKAPGVQSWLEKNAATYGFKRTVPSEPWHYEYWGKSGDPCAASTPPTEPTASKPDSAPATGIYRPKPGARWQWQLSGTIDTSLDVEMYDIDLFDAPQSAIDLLRAKGRKVICYFSGGSREDWRPDASAFASADHRNALDGWPGETWLDTRSSNVRAVMKRRLDLAVSKRCDGVEPDNVDGYDNDTGFSLTSANLVDYNRFLAKEAHARGLSIGLKNSLSLVTTLVADYDWALNEQCLVFSECADLKPFIDAGKAVFHVEYVKSESQGPAKKASVCGASSIRGFSTLIKKENDSVALDAWRLSCE